MTEENGNGMVMPVSPMYGGNGCNGFGFGGDWGWIILILLLAGNGGWGNGFGGGNGSVLPYMLNSQTDNSISRGFDNAAITAQLSAIQSALNSNAMAYQQGFNSMQAQFANCCCENRLATANLSADIAREACADRAAVSDGARDIIANQNAGIQRILDQMCNDKIDAKNERIADLERQLTMANLAASQGTQTATILANNEAQTAALEQYLAPVPRPAYIVQNPNCCQQNYGCGCGSF